MSITQALYDQILEERPGASKDELCATFMAIAIEDPELTKRIVREMFEVTWVFSKVVDKNRKAELNS